MSISAGRASAMVRRMCYYQVPGADDWLRPWAFAARRPACILQWWPLIVCLLAAVAAADTTGQGRAHSAPGIASLFQIDDDPLGERDSFALLPEKDKQYWARKGAAASLEARVDGLRQLELITSVEVRLVGFDGEGAEGVKVKESDFHRYMDVLRRDPHLHVNKGKAHDLVFLSKVLYHVTRAPRQLLHELHNAIRDTIQQHPVAGAAYVPSTVVESVLVSDTTRTDRTMPVIYLINTPPQDSYYAYRYSEGREDRPYCAGSFGVSQSERLLWIDLAAGPVLYGPTLSGDGLVLESTIPQAAKYPPKERRKAFVVDLVALVASATRHLLAPSLDRFPVPFAEDIEVRVIHISELEKGMTDVAIDSAVDWKHLEAVVTQQLAHSPHQQVRLTRLSHTFNSCEYCSAAFSRALHTATLADGGDQAARQKAFGKGLGAVAYDYLDSRELHHWLRMFFRNLMAEIGQPPFAVHSPSHTDGDGFSTRRDRVIPVYIFTVDSDRPHLLDRTHQAVAFSDMVIAVHTGAHPEMLPYFCHGQPVTLQPQRLTRPLLATILQAVWGVSPTHESWSTLHNSTLTGWLWSVGPTPFGPLSELTSLSFAQRDAAKRNVVLSLLNETVQDALELIEEIKDYGGEPALFTSEHQNVFSARFAVFLEKLSRSLRNLSLYSWPAALYWGRSAVHDMAAMREVAYSASRGLSTSLECFKESSRPSLLLVVVLVLCGGGVYGWRNRHRWLRPSKKKRF